MSDKQCFFKPSLLADGKPYTYSMHKTGKISGGTFPMGSVSYDTLYIDVPRSKFARRVHLAALVIKLISVFVVPVLVYDLLGLSEEPKLFLALVTGGILLGFLLVYGMYGFFGVKPIFKYARRFPDVEKYLKNGYSQGPHAFVTNTPFGLLYHLMKWLV